MLLGRVGLEVSRELTQRRVMLEEKREFDIKRVLKEYITSVSVKILGSLRGHARAARLFFFIQPIRSLFSGIVFAVVLAKVPLRPG